MEMGLFGPKIIKKPAVKTAGYIEKLVPKAGLEPARLAPLPPQDSVSTKFHHFGISLIRNPILLFIPFAPAGPVQRFAG
jgi:hypothetical protein